MAGQAGGGRGPIGGINVTPLVDVVLVLLIIVMVTAPAMTRRGMSVSLPKAQAAERVPQGGVRVVLSRELKVELSGRPVDRESLSRALKTMVERDPSLRVSVAADEGVRWGELASLLDDIRAAGVTRIGAEVGERLTPR